MAAANVVCVTKWFTIELGGIVVHNMEDKNEQVPFSVNVDI